MSIICRIGFCQNCYNNQAPKTGQIFWAFGSTSNRYRELEARRCGIYFGFTPHIYQSGKTQHGKILVQKSCAMVGCGVSQKQTGNGWSYYVRDWEKEIWRIENWNALVLLKHDQFTQIYEI